MGYEEPEYEVVEDHETYEVRRYAPYLVAETSVDGDFDTAGNIAFRRLFGYISGKNRRLERMEMTTPVASAREVSEKIKMTVPVVSSGTDDSESYVYHFVMPSKYTLETLPEPEDELVVLREIPERFVAVRRYSGRWKESNYRDNETFLLDALQDAGMKVIGEPQFARYNSPFTPWFMRRNEVLIEVALK